MLSPVFAKLAAWRRPIFVFSVPWVIVLVIVARSTANFRQHQRHAFESQLAYATDDLDGELRGLQDENSRLRKDLEALPKLSAVVTEMQSKVPAQHESDEAWAAQANALQAAIEQKKRDLAEIGRWSAGWHAAKTREAAEARIAEKSRLSIADAEKDAAETREILRHLALTRKRLTEITREWRQLDGSEKDQFKPRLQEAQQEWMAATERLGQDSVLYRSFPVTNAAQDPATVLLMQSIVPDQNGNTISVFLDGTVSVSR